MSIEANKALVRRYNEELWRGNQAVFDDILAPDCEIHGIGGPQDIKAAISSFRQAFPDAQITIDEQIAEGDKVMTRWTVRGTHQGDFLGIAPTGKQIIYMGITINRTADGKIVEDRFEADWYGLMHQLGAIPASAATET